MGACQQASAAGKAPIAPDAADGIALDDASVENAGTLVGDGADGDAALKWFYIKEACQVKVLANAALTAAIFRVKAFIQEGGKELSS